MGFQQFLQPEITCVSFSPKLSSFGVSATCPVSLIIQRRGAKPRLRQRTRSIPQTAGVFVCPRDVMVYEPSQDDRGRSLPRVIEVVRAALRASRRFDVVTATSTSNVPRENSPGCSRVAFVTGATPVPARVSFKFRSRTSRRQSARESDSSEWCAPISLENVEERYVRRRRIS